MRQAIVSFSLLLRISTRTGYQITIRRTYPLLEEGVDLSTKQDDEREQVEECDNGEDETNLPNIPLREETRVGGEEEQHEFQHNSRDSRTFPTGGEAVHNTLHILRPVGNEDVEDLEEQKCDNQAAENAKDGGDCVAISNGSVL